MSDRSFPPLRKNPDFVRLWTGQAISALGVSISAIAYPLLVLELTASPALAGLTTSVLAGTTFLLRLPAGLVADLIDRRRLMLLCDLGRFLALGSIAAAWLAEALSIVHIVIVSGIEGMLGVLFAPAEGVAVRHIVDPGQRREAVARNEARSRVAGLLGPSVSGVLFGWSRALPFAADAVSYLVSFITIAIIRTPLPKPSTRPRLGVVWQDLTDGMRWLLRDPFLRSTAPWLALAGAIFTSIGLITIVLAEGGGASSAAIGVMFAITASGGLVGAIAAPAIIARWSARAIIVTFAWVFAGSILALLVVTSPYEIGLVGAIVFLLVPAVNAMVFGYVAEAAPDAIHGRAVSATVQATALLQPVGPVLVGYALQRLGTDPTLLLYGGASTVLALVATVGSVGRGDELVRDGR